MVTLSFNIIHLAIWHFSRKCTHSKDHLSSIGLLHEPIQRSQGTQADRKGVTQISSSPLSPVVLPPDNEFCSTMARSPMQESQSFLVGAHACTPNKSQDYRLCQSNAIILAPYLASHDSFGMVILHENNIDPRRVYAAAAGMNWLTWCITRSACSKILDAKAGLPGMSVNIHANRLHGWKSVPHTTGTTMLLCQAYVCQNKVFVAVSVKALCFVLYIYMCTNLLTYP